MIPRYQTPEMADLWSDQQRYDTWLEVELAACQAMEAEGLVPDGTTAQVRAKAIKLDPARIEEIERTTRHDVIAFLTHVEELAGPPARWLHLGMTSSDVLDTAMALLLTRAVDLVDQEASALQDVFRKRAFEFKDQPMVGRTHGIHAEPTSLGLTFALWFAELRRNRERLARARKSVAVGKVGGAVGTYANVPPQVEARALGALGLVPEEVATQVVQRDRYAELVFALASTAAGIEKMAVTVRGWQRTEVGEANEPFGRGQKGSSAMPHKKNPILSENLCGLARVARAFVGTALENVALWHERDISHSSAERMMLPDVTSVVHFMLRRARRVAEGLVVHPEALAANLNRTSGLIFSQAVLLELVRGGMGRQAAYEVVQRNALEAVETGRAFRDFLGRDPVIQEHMGVEDLDRLFDVKHHLRYVDHIFDRVFHGRDEPLSE